MGRTRQNRFLLQHSEEFLKLELETHLKRASKTMTELMAYLAIHGASYETVQVVIHEIGGHLGYAKRLLNTLEKQRIDARLAMLKFDEQEIPLVA